MSVVVVTNILMILFVQISKVFLVFLALKLAYT